MGYEEGVPMTRTRDAEPTFPCRLVTAGVDRRSCTEEFSQGSRAWRWSKSRCDRMPPRWLHHVHHVRASRKCGHGSPRLLPEADISLHVCSETRRSKRAVLLLFSNRHALAASRCDVPNWGAHRWAPSMLGMQVVLTELSRSSHSTSTHSTSVSARGDQALLTPSWPTPDTGSL